MRSIGLVVLYMLVRSFGLVDFYFDMDLIQCFQGVREEIEHPIPRCHFVGLRILLVTITTLL